MDGFSYLIYAQSKERHHDDRYSLSHQRNCQGDEGFPISSLRVDGEEAVIVESPGVYRLKLKVADRQNAEVVVTTLFDGCLLGEGMAL